MNDKEKQAQVIKDSYKVALLSYPNVVGIGIGHKNEMGNKNEGGQPCITAMVGNKLPIAALARKELFPLSVHGIPTDVIQVGHIQANQLRTDRWRPAPGGVSIGHYKITAGTLGSVVYDAHTRQRLILSNNHVLANSNDAKVGDPILQPGPYDGGSVANDTVATLLRFMRINFDGGVSCPWANRYANFGNFIAKKLKRQHRLEVISPYQEGTNYVDAAVALPVNDEYVEDRVIDVGVVSGTASATIGMDVTKSGRTTETTHGNITLINATIRVSYGSAGIATFEDQLVSGFMSQGGDSGSLLVTRYGSPKAVGLLFAGSDQATIYNPIHRVIDAMKITNFV
jgi:hypothetical protein